jgi:hypothetical protein
MRRRMRKRKKNAEYIQSGGIRAATHCNWLLRIQAYGLA